MLGGSYHERITIIDLTLSLVIVASSSVFDGSFVYFKNHTGHILEMSTQ